MKSGPKLQKFRTVSLSGLKMTSTEKLKESKPELENLYVNEKMVYLEEETEYSKAYGPKAPYTRPEKPAWANRNKSGFDIRTDTFDYSRVEKTIHRNMSCFDIKFEENAKVEGISQYKFDFSELKNAAPAIQSRRGRVRRPGTFTARSCSLEKIKKTFDDDKNSNPTLKYFINLIARK